MHFNLRFNLDQRMLICVMMMAALVVLLYRGATAEQVDALLNAGLLGAGMLAGRNLRGSGPRSGAPA